MKSRRHFTLLLLTLLLLLAACAAPATPPPTSTATATATPVPPTPTPTPEPNLTLPDLWQAGFTTVANRADAFIIRKGDVTLDLSLLATAGDPEVPPALNPLRLIERLDAGFAREERVTLRLTFDAEAGRYVYLLDAGALTASATGDTYAAGSALFPTADALIPAAPLDEADRVGWARDGALALEQLHLAQDATGAPMWAVLARAAAPAWAWEAPAAPITYPLTAEELVLVALNADLPAGATLALDGDALLLHADGDTLTLGRWQPEGRAWTLHTDDAVYPLDALRVEEGRLVGETQPGEALVLWEAISREAEASAARRSAFFEFFLGRREERNYVPITTREMLANPGRYTEVMTVVGINPDTGREITFTMNYDPSTVDPRGIPAAEFYDEEGNDITAQLAVELLQEIDEYFRNKYSREGIYALDAERLHNQHTSGEQIVGAGYELLADINLADVDEVRVWYHGTPKPDPEEGMHLDHRERTVHFKDKNGQEFGVTAFLNYSGSGDNPDFVTSVLSIETDQDTEQNRIVLNLFRFEASQTTIKRTEGEEYDKNQATRFYFALRSLGMVHSD